MQRFHAEDFSSLRDVAPFPVGVFFLAFRRSRRRCNGLFESIPIGVGAGIKIGLEDVMSPKPVPLIKWNSRSEFRTTSSPALENQVAIPIARHYGCGLNRNLSLIPQKSREDKAQLAVWDFGQLGEIHLVRYFLAASWPWLTVKSVRGADKRGPVPAIFRGFGHSPGSGHRLYTRDRFAGGAGMRVWDRRSWCACSVPRAVSRQCPRHRIVRFGSWRIRENGSPVLHHGRRNRCENRGQSSCRMVCVPSVGCTNVENKLILLIGSAMEDPPKTWGSACTSRVRGWRCDSGQPRVPALKVAGRVGFFE